ncbi:MAG: multi-sensor hybrid histidine kinase [Thermoleophilia bacterium]|nr:multi-sensor hybrid histidine kinase [Thermoleophilia bacterium]
MQTFFDLAQDMLCIADSSGTFTRVNRSWTHTLGWSEEELCSRPYREFVHPDDRDSTDNETRELVDGRVTSKFRNRYRHKSGGYHWIDWRALVHDESGLIYASARDVTTGVVLHQELVSREELLTAMVAQQLRTREDEHRRIANDLHDSTLQHVVAALMYLDMIPGADSAIGSISAKVRGELQAAVQTTREIMQGLDPLDLRAQTFTSALESIAADVGERYGADVEVKTDGVEVPVDEMIAAAMCRMVREALVNAAKHAEATRLAVVVGSDLEFVTTVVRDDGRGIQAARAAAVDGERRGAGLGMAFMQERAASLDGTVRIESSSKGTAIHLSIPHAVAAEPAGDELRDVV